MNPNRARAVFRQHEKKMAELKEMTNLDANTMMDVINEGTLHLVEHFTPAIGPQYKRDYVFVMGKAFLGTEKKDPSTDVQGASFFHCGDIHEWSHDLADLMEREPDICKFVLHAIDMYHLNKLKPGGGGDY